MKIINRYVLKEHIGPFVFAFSALTSLLLLQFVARKFGDLVGRGLSWQTIGEFFLLSIPFTVAMTLPMSILVSVLYAFSRLAAENEVTALKAGGVSARGLMKPALITSVFLAGFMLWFNDQLLPRTNHELAALQMAIFRTKPTFALKPQVLNTVKEGQLYLRAGNISEDRTGHMRDVTIYDVSDASRRRTIYADSGMLTFAENKRDLMMRLYNGLMMSAPTNQPMQLNRIYYKEDLLRIRDVANSFVEIDADTASKGDREMSVCEMQLQYERAFARVHRARFDSATTMWRILEEQGKRTPEPKRTNPPQVGGIGRTYCNLISRIKYKIRTFRAVKSAEAAEVPPAKSGSVRQDTTKGAAAKIPAVPPQRPNSVFVLLGGQYVKVAADKIPAGATFPNSPSAGFPGGARASSAPPPAGAAAVPAAAPAADTTKAAAVQRDTTVSQTDQQIIAAHSVEMNDAKMRIDQARHETNRMGVEIQKKFSLAAACIVLVLVGAPIALRFPNGGVGLVFGVSFLIFAIYYVGLIGGEALSDKGIISPFWAMWADNIIFGVVGLLLMTRMGHEGITSRGGGFGETLDSVRDWFTRRGARAEIATASRTPS